MKQATKIDPAPGKLGVLMPGMGAVATTFIAGCMLARRGLARPIGSLTQMARIRLGKRTDNREPFLRDFVSLARAYAWFSGGWDWSHEKGSETPTRAEVLPGDPREPIKDE